MHTVTFAKLQQLLDQPIWFYPRFYEITGDIKSAIFLSRCFHWHGRSTNPVANELGEGWFHKSNVQWFEETKLSKKEQESCRKVLVALDLIEEQKAGFPLTVFYRCKEDNLAAALIDTSAYIDNLPEEAQELLKEKTEVNQARTLRARQAKAAKKDQIDLGKDQIDLSEINDPSADSSQLVVGQTTTVGSGTDTQLVVGQATDLTNRQDQIDKDHRSMRARAGARDIILETPSGHVIGLDLPVESSEALPVAAPPPPSAAANVKDWVDKTRAEIEEHQEAVAAKKKGKAKVEADPPPAKKQKTELTAEQLLEFNKAKNWLFRAFNLKGQIPGQGGTEAQFAALKRMVLAGAAAIDIQAVGESQIDRGKKGDSGWRTVNFYSIEQEIYTYLARHANTQPARAEFQPITAGFPSLTHTGQYKRDCDACSGHGLVYSKTLPDQLEECECWKESK